MKRATAVAVSSGCLLLALFAFMPGASAETHNPVPASRLIQPAELAQMLRSGEGEQPLILQVGSRVLFEEAHIAGSEYAGPAAKPSGLEALKARVRGLPRDRFLVLYCGCCPWNQCPNIRPAYHALVSMGFTNVKALYIKDNLGADWVDQGYPSDKGK